MGCKLDRVICSTTSSQYNEAKSWSAHTQSNIDGRQLAKLVEVKDVSDVGNYILAAKSRGRGLMGIDPLAQELVELSDYSSNCMRVKV